ncbi:hypothetical protein A1OE_1449 [Candidatus Endolissoclinum faulkneri L2]|uniref:Putative manganese efflux pump MntP n=1 Tax=Candidatus Endolissoclinum faulkneri L2 TaxID=1193729 RepID=K7Z637_9PROT|nr:manganese efflux pump [Candidatus Endolissoclinum faulkneri]AFX99618.1 hypothetical protein A1OE_1449 [Candidatus Endolissoclinum faulkneri L2]
MFSTLAIAIGVSADAFTVAIGKGARKERYRIIDIFIIAFVFALAETIALLIGWSLGRAANSYVAVFDHWFAFSILGGVGLRMIWESLISSVSSNSGSAMIWSNLALTSIGTSVDTLAVGAVLAVIEDSLFSIALAIAVVTFVLAFLGMLLGRVASTAIGRPAGAIGGIILITIGSIILIQHLSM